MKIDSWLSIFCWHRFRNKYIRKRKIMKTTLDITTHLIENFDKLLATILKEDLKSFKGGKGKFISNNQANTQDNDLLVA